MPLYEYACRKCARRFEALVLGRETPVCPGCGGHDLERLLSTFAVGGPSGATPVPGDGGGCGTCGDPRGPGACGMD